MGAPIIDTGTLTTTAVRYNTKFKTWPGGYRYVAQAPEAEFNVVDTYRTGCDKTDTGEEKQLCRSALAILACFAQPGAKPRWVRNHPWVPKHAQLRS